MQCNVAQQPFRTIAGKLAMLFVMLMLCIPCEASTIAKGNEMTLTDTVEVTQTIEARSGVLTVSLNMTNHTDQPVLVENIDWLEASPQRQEFEIKSAGEEIRYIGMMLKRAPYTRDDFMVLKPEQKMVRRTRIDQVYDFLPGEHEYQIVHWHLRYDEKSGEVTSHASAPAVFRFKK